MKNKKTPPKTPRLFQVQTGIEPPKKRGKESIISKKIFEALKKMPVGGSFLIEFKQEPTVRKLLKDNPAKFKDYIVTIRKAEEGSNYRRVYRIKAVVVQGTEKSKK